jgi:enamine deaminase RidA (YjgF/YER057c/UK114 family)
MRSAAMTSQNQTPEARLAAIGLELPDPVKPPPGIRVAMPWVNVRGDRAFVSGHFALERDGTPAGPFGRVGAEVSLDDGTTLARKTGLAMIASLKRELGELSRIAGWGRALGMIASAPDFHRQPVVMNGFSELIVEVFGEDVGRHSRSAVGMAALPLNCAVEIEAEVLLRL